MDLGVKGRREWVWRGVRGRSGIIHTLTTGEGGVDCVYPHTQTSEQHPAGVRSGGRGVTPSNI